MCDGEARGCSLNEDVLTDTERLDALCPQHIKPALFYLLAIKKWIFSLSPTLQNGEDEMSVT